MSKPEISILLANYNNGHYFKDAFDSLIAQTYQNWEAIVIDDCSTDDSVEVIKETIKGDQRFRFFQNSENLGYQRTIIRAISLSNAALFGRLDPDDTLEPNAVELSVKAHEENAAAGLVYSDIAIRGEDMKFWWRHSSQQIYELNEKYYALVGEISPFATFKRSIYNLTSGIDPSIRRAEDKDIYMKMCEVAPVVHIPKMLYNYRQVAGSLSTNENEMKAVFWHWVALTKMMDRRGTNIEDVFVRHFVDQQAVTEARLKRERQIKWIKNSWTGRLIARLMGREL